MSEEYIPSLFATLLERLTGQEDLELEFKLARGGLPHEIWPTISAFANTSGGWVILGVAHDEHTEAVNIAGVGNPPATLQNLHNALRNPQKISTAVCGANDATIESLGAQQVIVLRVPAAPRKLRPVYINGNPYYGTYLRRHSGDYLCTKQEVDRMMREASDVAADSAVLKNYTVKDLDLDSFARYRRQFQTRDPSSPWNDYDNQAFLEAIRCYRRDRETGVEGITVAGLLMLGKSEALREWRTPHMIDYRLTSGNSDADRRWEDRVVWEGNLFDGYSTIYRRLVEGLPVPFRLQSGIRIDQNPISEALREALVNLLVHTDYAETQASLVLRSPTEYLFRNPGNSRVLETDLLTGGRSDQRNPELVRMFRLVGLAEEAGTGIPKIVKTWRELGLHLPPIDIGTERYEFTIDLRMAHLLSEEDRVWLSALGESWGEAEQLALVIAEHEGDVDNPRLRRLTGQHIYDTTKVLGSLRSRQFLTMSRIGKTPKYELGPKAVISDLELNSGSNGVSSGSNGVSSDIWAQLERMAEPARRKTRLNAEARDKIILELCAHVPLSIPELATLMRRTVDTMRNVVPTLVASGHLQYLYPEQPSHPNQKYIATASPTG